MREIELCHRVFWEAYDDANDNLIRDAFIIWFHEFLNSKADHYDFLILVRALVEVLAYENFDALRVSLLENCAKDREVDAKILMIKIRKQLWQDGYRK